jgi:hypothetical protein
MFGQRMMDDGHEVQKGMVDMDYIDDAEIRKMR